MDRRKTYRVAPGKTDEISLGVRQQGGSPVLGEVVDVSLGGIGACTVSSSFALSSAPALGVGEQVELALTFVNAPKTVLADAMTVRRGDKDDGIHYGFRFIDHKQVTSQLSSEFLRLFNRRGSYRALPDRNAPVELTLGGSAKGTPVGAEVVDISAGGVAVRVASHVEVGMVAAKHIKVCISFPDSRESLNLAGFIRNHRLVGTSGAQIQYGIQFDWEASDIAERQQDAIVKYVMEQQRKHLRTSTAKR